MPFDCGLRTGVVHSSIPMSRSKDAVSLAMKQGVVCEPFDGFGQHVDAAEAVLHGGDHKVLYVPALDAFGGSNMGDCLTVAAVEGEGDADLLPVVAADLEAVGAPSDVRTLNSDLTVM